MTTSYECMKRERVGSMEVEFIVASGHKPSTLSVFTVRAYQLHVWDHQHGGAMRGEIIYTRLAASLEDGYAKFDEMRDRVAAHQLSEALGLTPPLVRSDASYLANDPAPEPSGRPSDLRQQGSPS